MSQLFERKPIAALVADTEGSAGLKRSLRAGDLIMLAIGAVIGAGIFGAIGTAAAGQTGPQRRSDPHGRGAGPGLFVPPAGRRLRAGGPVLRGTGLHDSAGRQRLRLFLRDSRGTGRLDHRMGPDSGIRGRQCRGGDFLGRLFQHADARGRRDASALADHRLSHGAAQSRCAGPRPAAIPRRTSRESPS